jgi:hypothetical protein
MLYMCSLRRSVPRICDAFYSRSERILGRGPRILHPGGLKNIMEGPTVYAVPVLATRRVSVHHSVISSPEAPR